MLFIRVIVLSHIWSTAFAGKWHFGREDPLQWLYTDHTVLAGIEQVHIDIQITSPCKTIRADEWNSPYDIKNTSLTRLQELCEEDYQDILRMVDSMENCLPSHVREKREIVTATVWVVIALVGVMGSGYKIYSNGKRTKKLEADLKQLADTAELIREQSREAIRNQMELTKLGGEVAEMAQSNKQAIKDLAIITPEIAYAATQMAGTLHRYMDGIKRMNQSCESQTLSISGLSDIIAIPELVRIRESDTRLVKVHIPSSDIIQLVVEVSKAATNMSVYEIYPIKHWQNYTTKPTFVEYIGPPYLVHNETNNCTRGIGEPKKTMIIESCKRPGWHDPNLQKWQPVNAPKEEIEEMAKPQVFPLKNKKHFLLHV